MEEMSGLTTLYTSLQRIPSRFHKRFREINKENDGVSFVFFNEGYKLEWDGDGQYDLVWMTGRNPGCLSMETLTTITNYMLSIVRTLQSVYTLTIHADDVVVTVDQNKDGQIILKALGVCSS